MCRRAWIERGVACLLIEDLADDWERQIVVNLCDRLYGKRTTA